MTSPTTPTTPTVEDADVSGVVENMLKSRAAQQVGEPLVLTPEGPDSTEQIPEVTPELSFVASANDAIIRARPAEMAAPASMEPGLTARGWSAEVTARHPVLLAETMAELADAGDAAGAAADALDPLDAAALTRAQTDLGFAQVRANNLRVRAAQLNNDRLSAAMEAAQNASPAAQAALTAAVESAEAIVDGGSSGEPEPAPSPTPAPAPTAPKAGSTSTTSSPSA